MTYEYKPPTRRPQSKEAFARHSCIFVDRQRTLYSDGYMIVRGTPPNGSECYERPGLRKQLRNLGNLSPALPVGEMEICTGTSEIRLVVFRIGQRRKPNRALAFVNRAKLDFATHGCPNPSFFISESCEPLVIKEGRQIVAVIMPVLVPAQRVEEAAAQYLRGKVKESLAQD